MNENLKQFIEKNFKNTGSALDLGAGDLSDVNYLKHLGWKCDGVDILTGVDLENPYRSSNGLFDLVFSNYVIHKLKNKSQLIKTAFDNMRDGGYFFLHTFDSSDKVSNSGIDKEWLKNEMGSVGFNGVEVIVFDLFDNDESHKHWHRVLQATGKK